MVRCIRWFLCLSGYNQIETRQERPSMALTSSKKRNILFILLCFLAYTSSYLLKLSYNANIVCLEAEFGITHAEAGIVTTFFFFTYGSVQILHGIFVKKYPLRFVVPLAILLGCVLNLLTALSPTFAPIKYYWLFDGAILSILWPSCIRALSENIEEGYRNKAIMVMGLCTAVGTILVYLLSALFSAINHYKIIFYVGIGIGIFIALLWFFFYPVLAMPIEQKETKQSPVSKPKNNGAFFLLVVAIAILCVISTFARDGISTWFPPLLKEGFGVSDSYSILIAILLPIGQFIGSVLSVVLGKLMKNRTLLCGLTFLVSSLLIGVYLFFGSSSLVLCIAMFGLSSLCFAIIVNIATSMIPLEWGKERNSGFYAALFNGFCYLGSTVSSYGLGALADHYGWNKATLVIEIALILAAILGILWPVLHDWIFKIKNPPND